MPIELIPILSFLISFYWMLRESDYLRINLMGVSTVAESVILSRYIEAANQPVKDLKNYLKKLLTTDLEIDGLKSKPKNITIGHGVFNAKLIKELLNLIPDNASIEFKSYPYKPAYKEWQSDGGYISRSKTPAKLACQWVNGNKAHWTLNSGYDVKYWAVEDNVPVGEWTPEQRKAYGIKPPKIGQVRSLHYSDDNPRPANGISLLDVELPIFNQYV